MNSYHFARLEERILLDGSVAAVAAPVHHDATPATPERVLVIPADTPQLSAFVNNTQDNVKVVVFDSSTTSLAGLQQQIVNALDGQQAATIAFLNRADASHFALSSTTIISESTLLNQTQMQQFWQGIGSDLITGQGQIDILASGKLSPNLLFGIQTLANTHVSEASGFSESDLVGAGVPSQYFNDGIIAHQDQLLSLLQSTEINTDTGAAQPPANIILPSDLIHFSINLTPDALQAIAPAFNNSTAWNYTMTPNQDGSLNIILSLSNSSPHLTASDVAAAANFITDGTTPTTDITGTGITGSSPGQVVIPGTVLHINLSITKEAFSQIENILSTQSDISFKVDQNNNATIVINNPGDFAQTTPGAFIAKEISILNSSLSINHESLQFTFFNASTDLNNGISTLSQNGAVSFFSSNSFLDYLGQHNSSHLAISKPASDPSVSYSNSIDHTMIDQNHNGIANTAITHAGMQNTMTEAANSGADHHLMNAVAAASSLPLASILGGVESSTALSKHLDNFGRNFNENNPDSSSTIISEQHLPNQRFGDQPFYPQNQKGLSLITLPPQDTTMKSVIGALSWAEFKIDGKLHQVPKESSLIQDFPNKTPPQSTDATLFSNKSVTNLKYGKGYLGLND